MRQKDGVDRIRLDGEAPHGDQRRGAAINQHAPAGRFEQDARLQPPTAAKRVATAQESNSHPITL